MLSGDPYIGFNPLHGGLNIGLLIVNADYYRFFRAIGDASAACPAPVIVNSPAVLDVNSVKNAGFNACAAPGAAIRHFNYHAFQTRHHLIQMLSGQMLESSHHAAAVAAKTDAQQPLLIRCEKNKIIHPNLAHHRHETGCHRPIHMAMGFLFGGPAADAAGELQCGFAHKKAANIRRKMGAFSGQPASAMIHNHMILGFFDKFMHNLLRQYFTGSFPGGFIHRDGPDGISRGIFFQKTVGGLTAYREITHAVFSGVHPGKSIPKPFDFPELEKMQHTHGGTNPGTA
jgi:hypothetical protein